MTILFFSRLFYPHIGGVEKHVLEVSKRLIKKGHKVIVITEELEKKLPAQDNFNSIKIYRIPVSQDDWFKKFRIWWWLWNHQKLIKEADIIHAHDVFFWYLPFRFLYPKKAIYTTFHGYEGNNLPTKKAIFMHKLAEKLSAGNICVGDYLSKWYGTKPDYVTYGGITISKSQISNLKSQNHSPRWSFGEAGNSKLKAVFVGRLEEETGIMEYLKAVNILKEKGYEIKLDVLGDGEQRRQAEEFCNSNKLDVNFKGFVTNVSDYLVEADFVFTSRFLSILEALSIKKFVFVAYNNSIKKDCFTMSPFIKFIELVKDEISLVSKFEFYLKNKDSMYSKIEGGYKWVSSETWEKMSDLYLKLWNF